MTVKQTGQIMFFCHATLNLNLIIGEEFMSLYILMLGEIAGT